MLNGGAAAYHVGDDGDAILLLDGGGYRHRTGAAAYAHALKLAIVQLAIYVLAVVGGDVDIERVKLFQLVDSGKELARSRALERGQHLEREVLLVFMDVDEFYNFHDDFLQLDGAWLYILQS